MSSASVLLAGLWFSAIAGSVVGIVSLLSGTAGEWVVLRAVGAFAVFMVLGLIAERVARDGLAHPPRAEAEPDGKTTEPHSGEAPALEPTLLTAGEIREEASER